MKRRTPRYQRGSGGFLFPETPPGTPYVCPGWPGGSFPAFPARTRRGRTWANPAYAGPGGGLGGNVISPRSGHDDGLAALRAPALLPALLHGGAQAKLAGGAREADRPPVLPRRGRPDLTEVLAEDFTAPPPGARSLYLAAACSSSSAPVRQLEAAASHAEETWLAVCCWGDCRAWPACCEANRVADGPLAALPRWRAYRGWRQI